MCSRCITKREESITCNLYCCHGAVAPNINRIPSFFIAIALALIFGQTLFVVVVGLLWQTCSKIYWFGFWQCAGCRNSNSSVSVAWIGTHPRATLVCRSNAPVRDRQMLWRISALGLEQTLKLSIFYSTLCLLPFRPLHPFSGACFGFVLLSPHAIIILIWWATSFVSIIARHRIIAWHDFILHSISNEITQKK